MTMVRLTEERRELLAERFAELANFAVAGLVFGQAVGQETFSAGIALAGMAIWLIFMVFSLALKGAHQ